MIHEASFVLKDSIQKVFLAKYRLIENPMKALTAFCKARENEEKQHGLFHCSVSYHWIKNNVWRDVCETRVSSRDYPRRYYKIRLQCKIGEADLKGLKSEWQVYY